MTDDPREMLRGPIREIIEAVPKDFVFDSHFVINELIKKHSDAYLHFTGNYTGGEEVTLTSHQQIGHTIATFRDVLVLQQPYKAWSENIHGNGSECTCWLKI